YLQSDTPLTLAETASVFGEMLTFHRLMGRQTNPAVKLALLCSKIEDAFATVFRQACMTRFEQKLHAARRKEGELTPETIGKFWMETNRAMFGDSVDLTDNYSFWWCYIPHFIHTPFYCYAYSFGELLVLSLYARYRKEGKSFVPKYLELLASGGSDNPVNLVKKMGLDIAKPSFWQDGMNIIEEMLTEAEHLAGVVAKGGVRSSASPKVKKVAGRRK
ncbi:MAG TPA: M3 family metallopeptidase, partial [Candidatus Ozemobacteraceae bacterium]|nr:M3 family metallopeptidase [Candidatus Ozemobacteraceae bacterium]